MAELAETKDDILKQIETLKERLDAMTGTDEATAGRAGDRAAGGRHRELMDDRELGKHFGKGSEPPTTQSGGSKGERSGGSARRMHCSACRYEWDLRDKEQKLCPTCSKVGYAGGLEPDDEVPRGAAPQAETSQQDVAKGDATESRVDHHDDNTGHWHATDNAQKWPKWGAVAATANRNSGHGAAGSLSLIHI